MIRKSKFSEAKNLFLILLFFVAGILISGEFRDSFGQREGPEKKTALPACALIADKAFDFHKSPIFSLLEAKLLKENQIRLVERADLDKIVEEQKLQLLLGAKGGAERVAFGKLLQAELLIILNTQEGERNAPYIDVIVCETKMGLRLSVEKVVRSDNPEEEATTILTLVNKALYKHKEGIKTICAVPPFVSEDFSHQYDYLQSTYAKLIEGTLLNRKGILTVELAEARAIAEEITLHGKSSVQRNLPFYLLGEYKNEGEGESRKISMRLILKQGDKLLKSIKGEKLDPQKAGSFLLSKTNELLAAIGNIKLPPGDMEMDARQLAERAKTFHRIGDWQTALALIEASLLLKPDQPSLHYQAVTCILSIMYNYAYAPVHLREPERISWIRCNHAIGLNYYRLAFQHADFFLRIAAIVKNPSFQSWFNEFTGIPQYFHPHLKNHEHRLLLSKVLRERRDMLLDVLEWRSGEGTLTDEIVELFGSKVVRVGITFKEKELRETREEVFPLILKAVKCFKDYPQAKAWTYRFTHYYIDSINVHYAYRIKYTYDDFLENLAKIPSKAVQEAAADLLKEFENDLWVDDFDDDESSEKASRFSSAKPAADIAFHPIKLTFETPHHLKNWAPIKKQVDMAQNHNKIYLIKEKGKAGMICDSQTYYQKRYEKRAVLRANRIHFDGKYIWSVVSGMKNPLVLAIDIHNLNVTPFTSDDGIPSMNHYAACTELGPGRILLVGCFSKRVSLPTPTRSWYAFVEITEKGKKKVEVFHEARVQADSMRESDFWEDFVICPGGLWTLTNPENKKEKIILMKPTSLDYLLCINPKQRSFKVIPGEGRLNYFTFFTRHKESVYWCNLHDTKEGTALWRLGFPDFKISLFAKGLEKEAGFGRPVFFDGCFHLAGKSWWVITADGQVKRSKSKLPKNRNPWEKRIFVSSHYGLLLKTGSGLFDVEFLPPQAKGPKK